MESERSGDVIIELEYQSQLTAGLDATRYFLSKSVKESTKTQYDRVYSIWRSFCRDNNVPEFGSDYKPIAACLSLVMMQDESYSKVEMLRAAIAYYLPLLFKRSAEHLRCWNLFLCKKIVPVIT